MTEGGNYSVSVEIEANNDKITENNSLTREIDIEFRDGGEEIYVTSIKTGNDFVEISTDYQLDVTDEEIFFLNCSKGGAFEMDTNSVKTTEKPIRLSGLPPGEIFECWLSIQKFNNFSSHIYRAGHTKGFWTKTVNANPGLFLIRETFCDSDAPEGYSNCEPDSVLSELAPQNNPFPDTDPAKIEGLAAAELFRRYAIRGYPDGNFGGSNFVERAEAAKFLWKSQIGKYRRKKSLTDLYLEEKMAAGEVRNGFGVSYDDLPELNFSDVPKGEWFYEVVQIVANNGIINGYSDGTFKPEQNVSLAEFMKMLAVNFELIEFDNNRKFESYFPLFTEIIKTYDLFPQLNLEEINWLKNLTRDEVCVAIYQYLGKRSLTSFD